MIDVVIDTNVIVSAMLIESGKEAQVLDLVGSGVFCVCLSPAIIAEYRGVLSRQGMAPVLNAGELLAEASAR